MLISLSSRETMFYIEGNNIKPLAPVIHVSITIANDGFLTILTLRHLNNNRFYANQTKSKEKELRKWGFKKKRVSLSIVAILQKRKRNLFKSRIYFCRMTVCIYQFFMTVRNYSRELSWVNFKGLVFFSIMRTWNIVVWSKKYTQDFCLQLMQ